MKHAKDMETLKIRYMEYLKQNPEELVIRENEEMVTLYHGTSSKYLPFILKEGLIPSEDTGTDNWSHVMKSMPNFTYLTTKWHILYAVNSTVNAYEEDYGEGWSESSDFEENVAEYPCYVKFEVPISHLIMDEDTFISEYLENKVYGQSKSPLEEPLENLLPLFDAEQALKAYGTVAYRGKVLSEYIKGFGILANKQFMAMAIMESDPYYQDYIYWQKGKGLGTLSVNNVQGLIDTLSLSKYYDLALLPKDKTVSGVKVNFKTGQIKLKFQK